MPYIAPEVITEAKRMDLLTYLREYEPNELVKYSNNTYTTRTHDSLKISNGKWMWWSRGIGGKSALDYLIKVRGMDFVEAVQTIMGNSSVRSPIPENTKSYNNQPLLLPERSPTTDVVFEYLFGRGIDYEIINYCLEKELVIESLPYHNVVLSATTKAINQSMQLTEPQINQDLWATAPVAKSNILSVLLPKTPARFICLNVPSTYSPMQL